ncbi:hypothetical protein ACU8NH_26820 (plasmid) [Rhizobium leguminosarum]|jgi:hypothetical protein|uniref:Uncharacterized protein n=1 Tax=Rhizobium leguminosarum TaxID=384 RepID=A0A7M3DTK8_RHILE|nr:hypothetical protein [Rhizobium leguminosarum]MDH6661967.1 hypothetical protein [Rhizobium sophorae]MBB4524852.1 hypothetical protein [Rhizobium leguminosarum]MBY5475678.1 hypothetical protein [Rhizobium leguminosarum]MBY5496843.1 hypothetical protein [Rhizobium leguminosarum]MBY5510766.1 hypothetical protein [Rhizobium leguminosarum]
MAEHGRVTSTMLDFAFRIAVFDRMQDCENGHVREHDESMIADISRPMSMYAKAGRGPLSKTSHYPRAGTNVEMGAAMTQIGVVIARSANGLSREALVKTFIRHPPAA